LGALSKLPWAEVIGVSHEEHDLTAAETLRGSEAPSSRELISLLESAAEAASTLRDSAVEAVAAKVSSGGKIDGAALEREERAAHGLAWGATYATAIEQLASYAKRMEGKGRFGEIERLLTQIGACEYLGQLFGGVMMSQGEIVRMHELGVDENDLIGFIAAARPLIENVTPKTRSRAVELIKHAQGAAAANYGDPGLDETFEDIRNEMRRFSEAEVVPKAQEWHLKDEYIPLPLIAKMSELGVFSLTLPEEYGGRGPRTEAACVGSDELLRRCICGGSPGPR